MGFTQDLESALTKTSPSCLDLSSEYVKLKISFLDAEQNKKLLQTISTVLLNHENVHEYLAQGVRDVKQYTKDKIVQAADASDDHRGRIEFLESRIQVLENQLLTLAQNIEGETIENEPSNVANELVKRIAALNEKQATIYVSDSDDEDTDVDDDDSSSSFKGSEKRHERKFSLSDIPPITPKAEKQEPAPEDQIEDPTVINQSLMSNVVIEEKTLDFGNDKALPVTSDEGSDDDLDAPSPIQSSRKGSSVQNPASFRKGSEKPKGSSRKSSRPKSKPDAPGTPDSRASSAQSVASSRKASARSQATSRKSSKSPARGSARSGSPTPRDVESRKSSRSPQKPKSAKSSKSSPEDTVEEPEVLVVHEDEPEDSSKPKLKKSVSLPEEDAPEEIVEFEITSPREGSVDTKTGIKARVSSATVRRLSREPGSAVSLGATLQNDDSVRKASLADRPKTAPALSRANSLDGLKKMKRRGSLKGVKGHPRSGRYHRRKMYSGKKMRRMMENPRSRWQQGIVKIMERNRLVDEGGVLSRPVQQGMSLQERVFRLEEQSNNAFTPTDGKEMQEKINSLQNDLGKTQNELTEAKKEAEKTQVQLKKMMENSVAANTIVEEMPLVTKRLEIVEKRTADVAEIRDLLEKQEDRLKHLQDEARAERIRRRSMVVAQANDEFSSLTSKDDEPRTARKAPVQQVVEGELKEEDRAKLDDLMASTDLFLVFKEQQEDWLIQRAAQLKDRVASAKKRCQHICDGILDLTKDTQENLEHKDAVNILAKTDMDLRMPVRELRTFMSDVNSFCHEDSILRSYMKLLGEEINSNEVYAPFLENLNLTEGEIEEISDKVIATQEAIKAHTEAWSKCFLRFLQLIGAMQSKEAMMRLHSQLMERLDQVTSDMTNFVTKEDHGLQHKQLAEDVHRISNMYGSQAQTVDGLTSSMGNHNQKAMMLENRIGELEAQVYVPENRFKNSPVPRSTRPPITGGAVDMEKVNAQIKSEVAKIVDLISKKQDVEDSMAQSSDSGMPTDAEEIKKIQDELEFTIQKVEGLYATKADVKVVDTKASKQEMEKKADKSAVRNLEQFMASFGEELTKTRGNTDKAMHKMRAQLEAQLLNALEEHFESNPQVPSAMAKHDSWLCMSCQRPATAPLKAAYPEMAPVKNPTGFGGSDVLRAGFRMPLQVRAEHTSPRDHGLRPISKHHHNHGYNPNQSMNSMMSMSHSERDLKRFDSGGSQYFPITGRPNSGTRSTGNLSTGRPGTTRKKKKPKKDIAGSWLQVDRIKPGPLYQVDSRSNQRSDDLAQQVEKLNQKMLKKL